MLLRPVLEPGAVFCVGLNYRAHAAEIGREPPAHPVWFSKLARTLADPGADLPLAEATRALDYEAEVAVVMGSADAVAGLTLLNDMSDRNLQRERVQVFAGKNLAASTPVGPMLVTPDEVGALDDLEIELSVNGERRQHGALSDLVFDIPALLADLSSFTTLEPGDIVATGTPAGVGMSLDPPRHLADGDVVTLSAGPLGTLTNRVTAATPA
jgi:acylpyruvate hydrolase